MEDGYQMGHIFFSYSRQDKVFSDRLVNDLRSKGFVIWQDTSDIPGGANWIDRIQAALDDSTFALVLWSTHSAESDWVKKEIRLADSKRVQIVPLLYDSTRLSDDLTFKNAIDFQGNYETSLNNLLKTLAEHCRPRLGFQMGKRLGDHTNARSIAQSSLVSVPLLKSGFMQAEVVGVSSTIAEKLQALVLTLQFKNQGDDFVRQVYEYWQTLKPNQPFIALAVHSSEGNSLDNAESSPWRDAVDTTVTAIKELKTANYPTLHFFFLGPSVLAFAIGHDLFKFWPVQLYNFAEGRYWPVLYLPPQ